MDKKHMNDLIQLSQEIYDQAADRLTNYCEDTYKNNFLKRQKNTAQDYSKQGRAATVWCDSQTIICIDGTAADSGV